MPPSLPFAASTSSCPDPFASCGQAHLCPISQARQQSTCHGLPAIVFRCCFTPGCRARLAPPRPNAPRRPDPAHGRRARPGRRRDGARGRALPVERGQRQRDDSLDGLSRQAGPPAAPRRLVSKRLRALQLVASAPQAHGSRRGGQRLRGRRHRYAAVDHQHDAAAEHQLEGSRPRAGPPLQQSPVGIRECVSLRPDVGRRWSYFWNAVRGRYRLAETATEQVCQPEDFIPHRFHRAPSFYRLCRWVIGWWSATAQVTRGSSGVSSAM